MGGHRGGKHKAQADTGALVKHSWLVSDNDEKTTVSYINSKLRFFFSGYAIAIEAIFNTDAVPCHKSLVH